MEKRGQMQISFGMIFSVILIIAIIGVSIYIISYFLNLRDCTTIGFFYDNLQESVDKAWASTKAQEVFEGSLPGDVESICFGNFDVPHSDEDSEEYQKLKRYASHGKNVFLYPNQGGCDANLGSYNLKHVEFNRFFCVPVERGKAKFKIVKESTGSSVRLEE